VARTGPAGAQPTALGLPSRSVDTLQQQDLPPSRYPSIRPPHPLLIHHPLRPLASTRRRTTRPYPSHHSLASLRPHGSAWHGHALSPDTNTTRRPRAQPITTTHHHRDSGHHPLQPPPTAPPTASHRAHHRWPQRAEGGTTRGQRQAEQHRARGARAELWAPPARQDDPAGGASATYSTCATHSTYSTYSTDSADCICSLALLTLPF
jgi:hypothetical protein